MPKKATLDYRVLTQSLKSELLRRGPVGAGEAMRSLGVSQPVFSRLSRSLGGDLLVTGKARSTLYALRREIPKVAREVPVYRVNEEGSASLFAVLHSVHPRGFYVESKSPTLESRHYPDLPYWLEDLRPAGFLGRLIPAQHPEAGFPAEIRAWSVDQTLGYLTHYAWNSVGNLVLGEESLRLHWESLKGGVGRVAAKKRAALYPKLAEQVLEGGTPGSSAGGEQPKFLAVRSPGGVAVLVKFSPLVRDPVGRRRADLLVAEHLAHETLADRGLSSTRSSLVIAADRVFLESERFDRVGEHGRRGVLSLHALDLEFAGLQGSWSRIATALESGGRIDRSTRLRIRWLELFGQLIGNSDMHAGNLAFFADGERLRGLAPVYDMLPMVYAPRHEQLVTVDFAPGPAPLPSDAEIWEEAWQAARDFWARVSKDERISSGFRRIGAANGKVLSGLAEFAARLRAIGGSGKQGG